MNSGRLYTQVFALIAGMAFCGFSQNSTTYETESLVATASSGDSLRSFGMNSGADPHLSGGYGIILEANAAGDYVSYLLNFPATGTCAVRLGVKKGASRGIVQCAIGGADLGAAQDLYAATDEYTELGLGDVNITAAGMKTVTFTVAGKNTASSDFWLAFDYIKLLSSGGTSLTISGSGLTVAIDTSAGGYSVTSAGPAWTFAGSLGQALAGFGSATGADSVGAYNEAFFTYQSGRYEGRIRVYTNSRPVVVFKVKSISSTNTNLGSYFPNFTSIPSGLTAHGFMNYPFAPVTFTMGDIASGSPGIYYDNRANTFILSPASHFMDAKSIWSASRVASGLQAWPNSTFGISNGYTHSVMLVVAKGINNAYNIWGHALTDYQNKVRPANDADMGLRYVGLWTDAQGPYWYALNGFANYDIQFTAIKTRYDGLKIKLGYIQLDSWWYIKDPNNWQKLSGCYLYQPVPSLFPKGIADLNARLGLPYITHNRWIGGSVEGDVRSPYRDQYRMSNGVSIDPAFWDKIMGDIKSWGVETYEQDWLGLNAIPADSLGHGEKFMDEMARASREHSMTLQYCMGCPRHYLQTTRYGNVTTLRTCTDRFSMPEDWSDHFFTSQFVKALGAWPWVDNYQTSELGNLVLVVLSGGMLGVSDPIDDITNASQVANLLKMVRRDGLSIKSDLPLVPTDTTYLRKAAGARTFLCATTGTVAGRTVHYVWDWANGTTNYSTNLKPADLGLTGNVYAYSYFEKTGRLVAAGTSYINQVSGATAGAAGTDWKYYVFAPVGTSGIAIVGDQSKYVTWSKNRIRDFSETAASATISVSFGAFDANSPDDPATIIGYSPDSVVVTAAAGGTVSNFSYNTSTRLFSFRFQPSGSYTGEANRSVTITRQSVISALRVPAALYAGALGCRLSGGLIVFENLAGRLIDATLIGINGQLVARWTIGKSAAVPRPACAAGIYEMVMTDGRQTWSQRLLIAR